MRWQNYVILAVGTASWFAPLILYRSKPATRHRVDRRARWGFLLVGLGYALPWYTTYWTRTPETWRVIVAATCFAAATALSWSAARALGRHWRFEASLNVTDQREVSFSDR